MANTLNTITKDGVTYQTDAYTSATTATKKNEMGKDAFLQLLVTQMQYQDPLDPQDNGEYLAQLAQFSSLEQMTNVAEGLSKVSTLVSNIDTSVLVGQLSSMIGQNVQWITTTTVTDKDGNAVLDKNGKAKTSQQTFEGTVKGVSISDGSPSIVAEVGGKTYQVKISEITRIGQGLTTNS